MTNKKRKDSQAELDWPHTKVEGELQDEALQRQSKGRGQKGPQISQVAKRAGGEDDTVDRHMGKKVAAPRCAVCDATDNLVEGISDGLVVVWVCGKCVGTPEAREALDEVRQWPRKEEGPTD